MFIARRPGSLVEEGFLSQQLSQWWMQEGPSLPCSHHLRNAQVLNRMQVFIVSHVYTAVFTALPGAKRKSWHCVKY